MASNAARFAPEILVLSVRQCSRELHPEPRYQGAYRWRVVARMERVLQLLRDSTGATVPSNAGVHGPGCGYPYSQALPPSTARQTARACGWWLAVAECPTAYPLLVRCLIRGSSVRGHNSPRTWFPLWEVCERFRTPGVAERWLRRVLRRADRALHGFGLRVAYFALGMVLQRGTLRPHKAAIMAADATVAQYATHRLGRQMHSLHGRPLARFYGLTAFCRLDDEQRAAALATLKPNHDEGALLGLVLVGTAYR